MRIVPSKNRTFIATLVVVTVAHVLLLLIPVDRPHAPAAIPAPTVSVRLAAPHTPEPVAEEPPVTIPAAPPQRAPRAPVELAELPVEEPPPPEPGTEPEPRISAHRILSEMQARREADPLAEPFTAIPDERPEYFVRYRPALDDVLNEPSLQLPFEDTRIYLVDSYDAGFAGDVQRFFHEVTVPFGFTTKNNTRVQCAWILVIAGCSWGDASMYYARDRAKKREPNAL